MAKKGGKKKSQKARAENGAESNPENASQNGNFDQPSSTESNLDSTGSTEERDNDDDDEFADSHEAHTQEDTTVLEEPVAEESVAPGAFPADPEPETTIVEDTTLPPRDGIHTVVETGLSKSDAPPTEAPSSLLAARQNEITIKFDSKDAAARSAIESGRESIVKTFNGIKSTIGSAPELMGGVDIDWDFWARVVENYDELVQEEPQSVQRAVADGIPKEFRGIVWQLVSRSKNLQLEELYFHLKNEQSVHERAIKRDLSRTSFFTNVNAANKADELFNVIKVYSLFDPDVGYTQGMVFIVVPLVMNMNEAECFCLLVTLMKDYGLRDLFCPEMQGLHLLLHQFDRLLEQCSPILYNHLVRQGIRSSMYASQWFLTFFSYKFPLDVVLRIFDMVITQGIEAVLRLAVNLMLRNESNLLRLNFDALLEFLKLNLFNIYVSDEFVASAEKPENKRFSLLGRKNTTKTGANYYKLDAFVKDAMLVDVSPADINRFKAEFQLLCEKDAARTEEIEEYRKKNGELRYEIKQLETEFYTINKDHMNVVQELVNTKVVLPDVLGDIEELEAQAISLEKDIQELEAKVEKSSTSLPQDVDSKIQDLLTENAKETERFAELEEKFHELSIENKNVDAELKQRGGKKWFW
ncbi:hypothetical protein FT663_05040 [Candidozyma haemuli var. vulneris]|uniref:GTPase-activating protein GYP5 n=1 Tax=Candidozyma haemuli TaxID=45357 RepID=A0A2V1AS43_9ASCO|nr:hypothetical protein CXQ85_003619 [[Candida] haemuloni]KAF3985476.1 hypothetical protein FT662_05122 [[Candida] haemuloni var. vulneris]KAF3986050.1 hypothetical protein FT663_05040 [[Candida] haemuloni var. vulneris]PVH19761.1 hypothetical protein CXQ85_003619 [[Candida] haemuloni]